MDLVVVFIPLRPLKPVVHWSQWAKDQYLHISNEGVRSWVDELKNATFFTTEARAAMEVHRLAAYIKAGGGKLPLDTAPLPEGRGSVEVKEVVTASRTMAVVVVPQGAVMTT